MLKRLLAVPNQQTIFSMVEPFPFTVFTDVGFGGESTASFENNRYFRGQLVGEAPFAAVGADIPEKYKNIRGFDGFSIRVKTRDLRPVAVNFKVDTSFAGSRFQSFLKPKQAGEFAEYRLKFKDLVLMFRGKLAKNQIQLDVGQVQRIYFTVGGKYALPGKFEVEIDRIQWVKFGEEEGTESNTLQRFMVRQGLVRG